MDFYLAYRQGRPFSSFLKNQKFPMGALALADSKTLAALPEVSIGCSVHAGGCGENTQTHVQSLFKFNRKGNPHIWSTSGPKSVELGESEDVEMRTACTNNILSMMRGELRQDEMRLLLPQPGSSQVLEVSDMKCNFLWRTYMACKQLVFRLFSFPFLKDTGKYFSQRGEKFLNFRKVQ